MAISAPTVGTSVLGGTAGTSATLDFTSAPDGALLVAAIGLADAQASAPSAPSGWTYVQGSEGTTGGASSRTILAYKIKAGDTTQGFSWGTSCKYGATPLWYPGVGSVEGGAFLAHTAANANFATASITPTGTNRWVLMVAVVRSTTAARTFTPDAAMVERSDVVHGSTNPWPTVQTADSNGAVAQTALTYTSVCSAAESHGGVAVLALIPANVVTGTGAGPLGALSGAATGLRTVRGTAAGPLGALTGAATGRRAVRGTAVAALGALNGQATGRRTVRGTAAGPLGALVGAAAGGRRVTGTGAAPLGALAATAAGTSYGPVTYRPDAGTTARPAGGTTARPDTGVTEQP